MKIQEDDKVQIKISSNRNYIPLNKENNKNIKSMKSKFLFSLFIFLSIIFLFSGLLIKRKKKLIELSSSKSEKYTQNEIKFLNQLKLVLDKNEIFENEMMNKHTTFQLGGQAKFFIRPNSINIISSYVYNDIKIIF